jgi:hypothetical protein
MWQHQRLIHKSSCSNRVMVQTVRSMYDHGVIGFHAAHQSCRSSYHRQLAALAESTHAGMSMLLCTNTVFTKHA